MKHLKKHFSRILLSLFCLTFMPYHFGCSSSSSGSSSSESDDSFSVSTPKNFGDILSLSAGITATIMSSVSDRDRLQIVYSSNYLSTSSSMELELQSANSTYKEVLSNTFYLVEVSGESCYRIEPELHSNYSIDYDSATSKLTLSNAWGYDRDADSGYLCFTIDVANNKITATKRYEFNTTSEEFDEDTGFTSKVVEYDSGSSAFILGSSAASFSFYSTGIDLDIPFDFNPDEESIVSNSRAAWSAADTESYADNNLSTNKMYMDTHSKYQDQVANQGYDDTTNTAAEEMLDQIEEDLESAGASLRYNKKVYLAYREALLKTTLQGNTIVNGQVGQNTAPYVFFTNESDDDGVPHPFMVIGTYSISDKPNRLLDVAIPPGDGSTGDYNTQSVTRDALLQTYVVKIPLKDYGLIDNLTDNTMDNTLADDVSETNYTVYNYASVNYIAVAIDGVMIYPVLNNTLASAHKKAEITNMGIHVGRGMGLHWHADGHGGNGNGLNLYNLRDYVDQSHPPLIGFSLDGMAIYGRYEASYSSMDGYSTSLDNYGGHDHGAYGYHYHAHSIESSELGETPTFTLHALMKGAWRGKINSIPEFWGLASQQNRYVGTATEVP